jgi:hypothetical protein
VKKKLIGIALSVALFVPFMVNAATEITIVPEKACLTEEGFCTTTAKVMIKTDSPILDAVEATLTLAEGVTIDKVVSNDNFIVTQVGNKVVFAPKDGLFAGDNTNTLMGTVVFKYATNLADCSVSFEFAAYETTKEVTITAGDSALTGASLPYLILGGALLLGGALYMVSKRSTKLYKI